MLDMTVLSLTVLGVVCLIGSIVWFTMRITEEDEKVQRMRTLPRPASDAGYRRGASSIGAGELTSVEATKQLEESTHLEERELVV